MQKIIKAWNTFGWEKLILGDDLNTDAGIPGDKIAFCKKKGGATFTT